MNEQADNSVTKVTATAETQIFFNKRNENTDDAWISPVNAHSIRCCQISMYTRYVFAKLLSLWITVCFYFSYMPFTDGWGLMDTYTILKMNATVSPACLVVPVNELAYLQNAMSAGSDLNFTCWRLFVVLCCIHF